MALPRALKKTGETLRETAAELLPPMRVELLSDREAVVDGCRGILEYSECCIRLCTGALTVRFTGEGLTMRSFGGTGAVVEGKIRQMNNEFRHIDAATDVLSFPLGENGKYDLNPDSGCKQLGDIVISVEHAVAQAAEFGHTFQREMGYLTVHSMLHLLGYDHVNGGLEKTIMREKEEEALGRLGLTRDNTYVE